MTNLETIPSKAYPAENFQAETLQARGKCYKTYFLHNLRTDHVS
jgi:hypothetical protein